MKPEQRERLVELLPVMRRLARRRPTQNGYFAAMKICNDLRDFLDCGPSDKTPEQWLVVAQEATREAPDRFCNMNSSAPKDTCIKGDSTLIDADGVRTTSYHHMSDSEIAAHKAARETA